MKKGFTYIVLVVDRSGSMGAIREETITGLNDFIRDQRRVNGQAVATLVQFDDQYEVVYADLPLDEVPWLTATTFVPRGSTALLDAFGYTIDHVGRHLARMPEAERPDKVIFATFTDGQENSSVRYGWRRVNRRIRLQTDKYNWTFTFWGAGQDVIAQAARLGFDPDLVHQFEPTAEGTLGAFARMSEMVTGLRTNESEAAASVNPDAAPQS